MDSALLLEKSILVAILTLITLGIAAYSTYGERKVAAFMQDRIGPNRAGKFGLLQPLADAGKLFFKEEFIPVQAEKWLFILGPCCGHGYRDHNERRNSLGDRNPHVRKKCSTSSSRREYWCLVYHGGRFRWRIRNYDWRLGKQ